MYPAEEGATVAERLTRREQQERNRVRLLLAAERVFAREGIAKGTLDDVAREAGLTKGAVYSNFDGKEDLITQVIRHRSGEPDQAQFTEIVTSGSLSPEERIDAWGREWVRVASKGERYDFGWMLIELILLSRRQPAVRAQLAEMYTGSGGDSAEYVRRIVPDGSALADLPDTSVIRLLNALDLGVTLMNMADPEGAPLDLYRVALRLLTGLRPEPETPERGATADEGPAV